MKCNIDKRGRAFRAVVGAVLIALAFILPLGIVGRVLFFVGGLFGVFEGLVGWCAVRAMGIRTWL
ncbi:MAG: YgaP family membrane protein [bacterium]